MASNIQITHLLFMDDIFLFSRGNKCEIRTLKDILDLFMKATSLAINKKKYSLSHEGIVEADLLWTLDLLPFLHTSLDSSIKYLGFLLKPDGYRKQGWFWLVSKIEKRINSWSNKWLSRVGRLVLIKSVLLSILVYWIILAWVPIDILNKIRSIYSTFLWSGKEDKKFLPWVS